MVFLYYCDVRPLMDDSFFQEILGKVRKDRQDKVLKNRNQLDRCRSLGAGYLLRHGFGKYGVSYEDAEFAYVQQGKMVLAGNEIEQPKLHFNLSHAGYYAVAAFAEQPIGVDIETERLYWKRSEKDETGHGRLDRIARRTFTPEELAVYENLEDGEKTTHFTRIWTRKESYIKATGKGLSQKLSAINTLCQGYYQEVDLMEQAGESSELGNYKVTYCTLEAPEPEYQLEKTELI